MEEGCIWSSVVQVIVGVVAVAVAGLFSWSWMWKRGSRKVCAPEPVDLSAEESWIPFVGSGLAFVKDPTAFLLGLCQRYGVERPFLVHVFGFRLLFVFSPHGLREFYR